MFGKKGPIRCLEYLCPQSDGCAHYLPPTKAFPNTREMEPKVTLRGRYGEPIRCDSYAPKGKRK